MNNTEGELNSLVLYVLQSGTAWYGVQDGCMLCNRITNLLEIQQGKEGTKSIRYHLELGATAACDKIPMEETKGLGQSAFKVSKMHCFLFDSWLLSKKSA